MRGPPSTRPGPGPPPRPRHERAPRRPDACLHPHPHLPQTSCLKKCRWRRSLSSSSSRRRSGSRLESGGSSWQLFGGSAHTLRGRPAGRRSCGAAAAVLGAQLRAPCGKSEAFDVLRRPPRRRLPAARPAGGVLTDTCRYKTRLKPTAAHEGMPPEARGPPSRASRGRYHAQATAARAPERMWGRALAPRPPSAKIRVSRSRPVAGGAACNTIRR